MSLQLTITTEVAGARISVSHLSHQAPSGPHQVFRLIWTEEDVTLFRHFEHGYEAHLWIDAYWRDPHRPELGQFYPFPYQVQNGTVEDVLPKDWRCLDDLVVYG